MKSDMLLTIHRCANKPWALLVGQSYSVDITVRLDRQVVDLRNYARREETCRHRDLHWVHMKVSVRSRNRSKYLLGMET